jgi:hypothetical protein
MENWIAQSMAADALRVLAPVFHEARIPLIPIKGIVLGRWLYEDIAQRPLSDLDLLIRRRDRGPLLREIQRLGWPVQRNSEELGELSFVAHGVVVEAHAEVVRRDLTRLTVEGLLARSTLDLQTFDFEIQRIDDVDHALLLVVEIVKDWFVDANPHQPGDLERLMAKVSERSGELIARAEEASFLTGLYNAATWMSEEHGSASFRNLLDRLGAPPRCLQPFLVRRLWRSRKPARVLGLGLSCWTNDRWDARTRCLVTIARRGLWRAAGLDPG